VEWQVKTSLHQDVPELIDEIAAGIAKVGAAADAIASKEKEGALAPS
jgi:hypothetical protein